MPVHRPDKSVAGVTALDVGVEELVRKLTLPPGWSSGSAVYLAQLETPGAQRDTRLKILARGNVGDSDSARHNPDTNALFSDAPQFGQMLDKMALGQSGVWRIPLADAMFLWGHASAAGSRLHVLVLIPYDAVVQGSTQAE